jgi:alpha-ketoglutarate-dependent taurine dioxygenase
VRFDAAFTEAVPGDREAAQALVELHHRFIAAAREITLDPGEILVLDNRRVLHGRKPFRARYDGTDRWLRRAMVRRAP